MTTTITSNNDLFINRLPVNAPIKAAMVTTPVGLVRNPGYTCVVFFEHLFDSNTSSLFKYRHIYKSLRMLENDTHCQIIDVGAG